MPMVPSSTLYGTTACSPNLSLVPPGVAVVSPAGASVDDSSELVDVGGSSVGEVGDGAVAAESVHAARATALSAARTESWIRLGIARLWPFPLAPYLCRACGLPRALRVRYGL